MLEAVVALPLFIFVMLALLDLARIGLVTVTLQFVTASALRTAAIGLPDIDSAGGAQAYSSREDQLRHKTQKVAAIFGVSLNTDQIGICEVDPAAPEVCRTFSAGSGGSYVRVHVLTSVHLLTMGARTLEASAVSRNEFF